jgi:uncharacterized protein
MRVAFLDTVGLIALWDATDQWHTAARRAMDALEADGARLVTSSYILLECGNAAARKPYRQDVHLLRELLRDKGDLIEPTEAEVQEAWVAYVSGGSMDAGVVDHVSFILMRRLGIIDAFTNDRHFKAARFNTLF